MKNKIVLVFLFIIGISSFSSSYRGELIAEGEYITVDFKEMPITDVIRVIGRKFNINLIAGNDVKGKVTVSFDNVLVDDALESILSINGYTYVKVGNIIKVISVDEAKKEFLTKEREKKEKIIEPKIQKTYYLEYADAQKVAKKLEKIIEKDDKLIVDEKTNNIIMWVNKQELKMVDELIQHVDIPQAMGGQKSVEIIKINYIDIDNIIKLIDDISGDESDLKINKSINSLIITGEKERVKQIKDIIKKYDAPPLQVSIEVNLIEKSLGDGKNRGINWRYAKPSESISGKNSFEMEVGDKNTTRRNNDGLEFKLGTIELDNFEMVLQDLLTDTEAELLSSPNITTLNNKKATIHLGDKIPYRETSGSDTTTESYKFEEVGIKLEVTPIILEDGRINLEVIPEVSSVSEYTPDNIPIISTRMASTNVIVKDGETLVIGGLIKNEKTRTMTSVPILGKIPIIGNLFRSTIKQNQKVNLMVFIKSKIIKTRPLFNDDINLETSDNKGSTDTEKTSSQEELKKEILNLKEENNNMGDLKKLIGGE